MGLTAVGLLAGYVLLLSCFKSSEDEASRFAMAATPAEVDALLDLKVGFNDPPSLADWRRDREMRRQPFPQFSAPPPHECNWTGITCSDDTLSIERIDLPMTFRGGSIRPSIGSFPFLKSLDLSGNALSGSIPEEITVLESLVWLHLQKNMLSGELPAGWGRMRNLTEVHLWKNQLNGSIPGDLFKAGEVQRLRLENNNLSGEIPEEIVGHKRLRYLAVMSNQLTGQIPSEVGNVTSLRSVYAGFNRLNGTLPESMGHLRKLVRLDLQQNQLHGIIPASWSNLTRVLLTLNLSGNALSGEVPAALLERFNGTSFMNNTDLCGATFTRMCETPPLGSSFTPTPSRPPDKMMPPRMRDGEHSHDGKFKAIAGVIGGTLGAVAVFVLFLLVFLCRRSRSQRRDGSQVQNWFSPDIQADRSHGKFELYDERLSNIVFQDIESHAGYFDTAHVIGRGRFATVYRSHFPNGMELAVKVFKYPIVTAAFDREIAMLSSIQHPCLLPIRGYYSTSIEKALVCDYFPSGTLYRLLHGEDASSPSVNGKGVDPLPDWATRQKIAFGVAQALDYLHRGSSVRVVHMDVKSANILLETTSLHPRLADFGIVHLISNKPADSNDVVVDTEGYTAPEALTSRNYSDKSDVYSFGVVLLEIITGKKAVCWVEDKKLVLASWAEELSREKRGREIMDAVALKTSPFPEYLDRALSLALLCVSETPSMRPSMAEVASVLEGLASNPSPLRSPDLQMVKPLLLGR